MNKRIKELRLKKRWTQTTLGKKLNLTKQQIHRYEKEKQVPPLFKTLELAKIFKCNFYWLVTGESDIYKKIK